jgi:two-component system cell cycle sensor histidine kinase/response regulator CckA
VGAAGLLSLILIAIAVVVQLVAAGLALRLIRITKYRTAWSLIAGALLLMAVRRGVTLAERFSGVAADRAELANDAVGLAISLLMLAGVAGIGPLLRAIQRHAEELRRSEDKFRTVANYTRDWEYWQAPDKRILFTSPSCASITGYPPEAFYEESELVERIVHPDDRAAFLDHHHGLSETEELLPIVFRIVRRDGTMRWIGHVCTTVAGEDGRSLGKRVSNRDVTAEKAAQAERAGLLQMVDAAPAAITVHGANGRFVYANQRTLDLHGYSREEFLALPLGKLDAPETARLIASRMQTIMERGEDSFEVEHYRKDGSILPLHVHARRMTWGEQPVVLSVATDLTERRRAEDEIRRLAMMLDIAPSGVAVHDLEGRFVYVNQRMLDMHGYTRDELMRLNLRDLTTPESGRLIAERTRRILEEGELLFEVEHLRKDGATLPLMIYVRKTMWAGRPVFLAINTDIAERRQMQETLERSEDMLRTVVDSMSSGVLVTDALDAVQMANPAARTYLRLGLSEEVTGHPVRDTAPAAVRMLRNTAPGEQERVEVELRDGSRRTFGFTSSLVPAHGLRVTVFRDLTVLVDVERRRQRAEQLAQVGELAAKLSHEIKNPLGTMLVGLGVLEREPGTPETVREVVASLLVQARQLVGTMSNVLDAARLSPFYPQPAELSDVVREALAPFEPYCRANGVELAMEAAEMPLQVCVDRTWTRRLVANLIINAVEATGRGGMVRVSWGRAAETEAGRRFPGFPGEVAFLRVADNGPGIPPEHRAKAFTPFFTTKPAGTGLGLAVAMEVAETHGGTVELSDTPGHGATFTTWLPAGVRPTCHVGKDLWCEPCVSCEVRRTSTGFCCWAFRGQSTHAESGRWPDSCRDCATFKRWNLGRYLSSGSAAQ